MRRVMREKLQWDKESRRRRQEKVENRRRKEHLLERASVRPAKPGEQRTGSSATGGKGEGRRWERAAWRQGQRGQGCGRRMFPGPSDCALDRVYTVPKPGPKPDAKENSPISPYRAKSPLAKTDKNPCAFFHGLQR